MVRFSGFGQLCCGRDVASVDDRECTLRGKAGSAAADVDWSYSTRSGTVRSGNRRQAHDVCGGDGSLGGALGLWGARERGRRLTQPRPADGSASTVRMDGAAVERQEADDGGEESKANGASSEVSRIGLHDTAEELALWRERAAKGPYRVEGDAGPNTPRD